MALQNLSGRPLILLITVASSCGFLLFGYDNGVFSGLIVSPWFLNRFHHPNSSLLGTVSAMYNIGGFIGSLIAFFVGSILGRRVTIMIGIVVTTVGAVIQASATNLGELISGRIICGAGVGTMTSTVGLWQAEVAPARSRGAYLTFQLLGGAAAGLFLAQWINYGFHTETGRVAFTFPLSFQLIFLVVSGALIPFLPESPRWLVKQDRRDEARTVLARLGPSPELQLVQIDEAVALESRGNESQYRQLFTLGPTQNFRRLCLACSTSVMHQLGGINSVTYYMPTLLGKFIDAPHSQALWISGLTSVMSILCAIVPVLAIDRVGRRVFLWGGAVLQAIMFIIISVLLAKAEEDPANAHKLGVVAVVMVFLFYGINAMTWLGPSWAYPPEILPLQIREKGLALANVFYWLFQFMIVEITPIALTNIGYKFYVILAAFNVGNALFVYFLYLETKGLSLEQIDFYFAEKYGFHTEVRELGHTIGKTDIEGEVEHHEGL